MDKHGPRDHHDRRTSSGVSLSVPTGVSTGASVDDPIGASLGLPAMSLPNMGLPNTSLPALGLPALALSVVAILVLAAVFVAALAATIGLAQVAVLGARETRSFYLSLRFDIATQAKLAALAVSAVYTGLALATVVLAFWRDRRGWRDLVALAPTGPATRRHGAITAMVLVYAGLATLALALPRARHVPLEGPTDPVLLALLAANYILFAPIAEELLFRGWIYTGLRRRLRFGATVLATSLLFAAIHWEPRHMALVLPLAFALGFIREQTGGIRPTIALHAGYNLVIVTITLLSQ